MSKDKLFELGAKALLIFEGIVLGIICVLMYLFFSKFGAVILITICLMLNLSLYIILKQRYVWMLRNHCEKTTSVVKKLRLEGTALGEIPIEEDDFKELYEELELLRISQIKNDKLRSDIFSIVDSITVNIDFQIMLEDMLPKIIDLTESNCGAFYIYNKSTNKLEIKYSLGFSKNIFSEFDINLGEGLIGDIAKNKEIKIVRNVPEDTIYVARTFLGTIKPRNLMVIPITNQEEILGVLVLSSIHEFKKDYEEHANLIRYYMGIAAANGLIYETNKMLTNELKFQNKLIQDFNAELEKKVSERSLLFDNVINSIKGYAIYSMDKNGVIQTWNVGAEELIGYSAMEVIGQHVSYIYPREEVARGAVRERMNTVIAEGRYNETLWRTKKDGTEYYADVAIFSIHNNMGELIGFTNVTSDHTHILRLEKEIQAQREFTYSVLNYTDKAVMLTDNTGIVKYINLSGEKLFALNSHEVVFRSFSSLFTDKNKVQLKLEESISALIPIETGMLETVFSKAGVNIKIQPIKQELKELGAMIIITEVNNPHHL